MLAAKQALPRSLVPKRMGCLAAAAILYGGPGPGHVSSSTLTDKQALPQIRGQAGWAASQLVPTFAQMQLGVLQQQSSWTN